MEYERNNILEDFRYGFCDLSGESPNIINELESQLGWNEEAVCLLKELYPTIGRMNLNLAKERVRVIKFDEYDPAHDELFNDSDNSMWHEKWGNSFCNSKKNNWPDEAYPREALEELSDYNDIIVGLRHLLYSEIELSNYILFDKEYNEDTGNILFRLGLLLTNFFEDSFERAFIEYYYDLNEIGTNSPRVKELADFIDKQITGRQRPVSSVEFSIECLEAIKNSGLAAYGDRLWNLFLIKLYSIALFNDPLTAFQESDISSDDGRYESFIRKNYGIIDNGLQMLQRNNARDMLMLYSSDRLSSRVFYNRDVIRLLYNALNSSDCLRQRYLITIKNNGGKTKNPSGKKPFAKCFAAMYNKNTRKKYAAISGVFDADMYIYPGVTTKKESHNSKERKKKYNDLVLLLKAILGNSYEVIDSDNEVKYYCKSGIKKITAKRYIDSVYPVDKRPGNRMFSCCERKLSTKLEPGCEHDLYIKYAPCTLCDRMIKYENKNKHFIHVFYAGQIKDLEKRDITLYDQSANAVK